MSRKVIHDLVLPVVINQLNKMGYHIASYDRVDDKILEEYFEEQLTALFKICGEAGKCEKLEERIKELIARDPDEWRELIKHLLDKYINLKTKLMTAEKLKKKDKDRREGPPDRFKEQRKKAHKVWGYRR